MAETLHASVDPYGFEYPDDFEFKTYDEFMTNYLTVLARRAKKWDSMLGPAKTVGRGSKVKRYIRKGIPREHRGMLWMAISSAQDIKDQNPNLYKTLLEGEWNSEVVETIKIDIPRTFPDNIYFKYATDGKRKPLFNVLVAFAHQNLNVGYCQGLNFIAGILLLITDNEEITFWLLRMMVERILPDYYTKDMLGLLTDMEVLSELVRVKVPQVYQHLLNHNVAWPLVASKWFICLFAEVLPIETVLRIWDCMFYEGSKILFRVAVTLVIKNQDRLLAARNFPEILDVFKDVTQNEEVTDCHVFMQSIFKEPGSFPMSLVSKLRSQCRLRVKEQQDKQQQQIQHQQKLMKEKMLKDKLEREKLLQNGTHENEASQEQKRQPDDNETQHSSSKEAAHDGDAKKEPETCLTNHVDATEDSQKATSPKSSAKSPQERSPTNHVNSVEESASPGRNVASVMDATNLQESSPTNHAESVEESIKKGTSPVRETAEDAKKQQEISSANHLVEDASSPGKSPTNKGTTTKDAKNQRNGEAANAQFSKTEISPSNSRQNT